jgi:hypothetical protein
MIRLPRDRISSFSEREALGFEAVSFGTLISHPAILMQKYLEARAHYVPSHRSLFSAGASGGIVCNRNLLWPWNIHAHGSPLVILESEIKICSVFRYCSRPRAFVRSQKSYSYYQRLALHLSVPVYRHDTLILENASHLYMTPEEGATKIIPYGTG